MNISAVIIAGGSGTRLWPVSRSSFPKQFIEMVGDKSMLQSTFERLDGLNVESKITVCAEEHRFLVAEQLREIGEKSSIILEPCPKNTAPAIALAAFSVPKDQIMLVMPADHVINDISMFHQALQSGINLAEENKLVTFGLNPSEPHTGYGYIEKGNNLEIGFDVKAFKEKPTKEKAKEYIASGKYLWNMGIFMFKAETYLSELENLCPEIYKSCELAMQSPANDLDFIRINEDEFNKSPSLSIDYGIFENTNLASVIEMNVGWNDLGSWASIWDIKSKDENGMASHGHVFNINSKDSLVHSENQFVATIGVKDLIIISTKDSLMVANKNNLDEVKLVIDYLKAKNKPQWQFHREVYRPWGKFDSLEMGNNYQVKKISVKPGAKLSLQMHHHRSEHWVVVSGTAQVTKGENVFTLNENQSTYIEVKEKHSLENIGEVDLEIIEIQTGSYLGEDDIVRFDDIYGRIKT